jgi:hypothetical protein
MSLRFLVIRRHAIDNRIYCTKTEISRAAVFEAKSTGTQAAEEQNGPYTKIDFTLFCLYAEDNISCDMIRRKCM